MSAILFWLFLISIPFGFRVLLYQFTPGFHEYESVFLYASDFLMFVFLAVFFWNQNSYSHILKNVRIRKSLVFFLVLAAISVFSASYRILAFYNFVRLALLILTALAIGKLLQAGFLKLEKILAVIAGLAIFESLMGLAQFYYQKSLGLWFLGESVLGEGVKGIAKIDVEGGSFLRAYGTFPHPNVLAGFLLLGLFSLFYFWLKNDLWDFKPLAIIKRIFTAVGVYLIALGLLLTFSRTAWFIALFFSLLSFFYFFINKFYRLQAFYLLIILFSIFYFLFSIFDWAILPRTSINLADPAVSQRLIYNALGLEIIKNVTDNFFGVGIGNQVIYSVQNNLYRNLGMNESWQWQPIHNIYLLIASEIGIMGLAAFLIFIAGILILQKNGKLKIENGILFIMLSALLLFGFFDHFLWTLQPGRLMFWLVIGLMI
ncbi:MAG: O-antigen ligase family protein [Candidatus Brennerbacteria bacterium]|nr:O-antigen ligase family protein [Candidatus Brennerbacteria bacterium]